jgi:hypothetical protein
LYKTRTEAAIKICSVSRALCARPLVSINQSVVLLNKGIIMKNKKTFFIIGSIGFIITASMQMLMATLLSSSSMAVWLPMYISFATFMIIGLPKSKTSW